MKKWINFLLMLTSVLFILFFIWLKFIRIRLPRDIPFNLSLLGFLSIVLICCACILTIKLILYPSKSNSLFIRVKDHIVQPLCDLHYKIRTLSHIKIYYQKSFLYLLPHLQKNYKILVTIEILVRACMLYFFMIDVIILNKLFYSYKIVYILIASYLIKLLFAIIQQVGIEEMKNLDEEVDIYFENLAGPVMRIDYFIDQQVLRSIKNLEPITYSLLFKFEYRAAQHKKLNLTGKQRMNTTLIYDNMRGVLTLIKETKYIVQLYQNTYNSYKYFLIMKSIIYLILWVYILIRSMHPLIIIKFFQLFSNIYVNPFI